MNFIDIILPLLGFLFVIASVIGIYYLIYRAIINIIREIKKRD